MSLASSASLLTLPVSSAMSFLSTRRGHLLHTALPSDSDARDADMRRSGASMFLRPKKEQAWTSWIGSGTPAIARWMRSRQSGSASRRRITKNYNGRHPYGWRLVRRFVRLDDILAEPSAPAEPS